MTGRAFPGGITNACIHRTYAGRHMRDAGAWLWELFCIERVFRGDEEIYPHPFGSQWSATEAIKDPDIRIDIGDWP